MDSNTAKELLQRYLDGNCNSSEKMLVDSWYAQLEATGEEALQPDEKAVFEQLIEKNLFDNIQRSLPPMANAPVRRISFRRHWWVAASLLLLTVATIYLLTGNSRQSITAVAQLPADIPSGKQGAILTLSDGSEIVLDSLHNGTIARQNGTQVMLNNGELSYNAQNPSGGVIYNTMRTPNGRQFMVRLPDGTKAWLNAASTITYPTAFSGTERSVKTTGEVYFEVAPDKTMPFRVNVNDKANVEVLGTHFNINAYENQPNIATTLLEGAVRVAAGEQSTSTGNAVTLQPGQQARMEVGSGNKIQVITVIDKDQVIAWKNGFFNFEGANLREMMQQVERWYDITVIVEKGAPDIRFAGKINRNVSLAGILKALDEAGVHYRMSNNRQLVLLPL